jgi:AraC family transcriptional regulator
MSHINKIKNLKHNVYVERQFNHAVTPCQSEHRQLVQSHLQGIDSKTWQVDTGDVVYCNDEYHTLSLYIDGGEHSFRKDKRSLKGGAGKICLMPKGHQSNWSIRDNIRFLHFYFSEKQLNEFIAQNFDSDVRLTSVVDQVYAQIPQMRQQLIAYHKLSNNQCTDNAPVDSLRGGLSQENIKRITSFIAEYIDQAITLDMLANEVNRSTFQFAKMFKVSFGQTPAQYIINVRLNRVKDLLKSSLTLADISVITGFSHQSHMTSCFRQKYGITPYRVRE